MAVYPHLKRYRVLPGARSFRFPRMESVRMGSDPGKPRAFVVIRNRIGAERLGVGFPPSDFLGDGVNHLLYGPESSSNGREVDRKIL